MRCQSTSGLDHDQVRELVRRVGELLPPPARPAGRPAAPGLRRSVLLTLILLRHNLPQTLARYLFGVSQPTVSRVFRRYAPLLGQVTCPHIPPLSEVLRDRAAIVDGTLVPTARRAGRLKAVYNGKRREHGLGLQVLAGIDGTLLHVADPVEGRTHDRHAFTRAGYDTLIADTVFLGDLGYQGTAAIRPRRKRPGHIPENKIWNRGVNQIGWAVEQAIAYVKNWKILATGSRARLTELPTIIRIVTSLEHYRLGW